MLTKPSLPAIIVKIQVISRLLLLIKMASQNSNTVTQLDVISFNMHGFNQGCETVKEIIDNYNPDVFLLQEHWLTPNNLSNFDCFTDYFLVGSSAMSKSIESGILVGRPFGGVVTLIRNSLRSLTSTIYCTDRYAIVKISKYIIINLYLPCSGTQDRLLLCESIFDDIWSWREQYDNCNVVDGSDFNVDLDSNDVIANFIN